MKFRKKRLGEGPVERLRQGIEGVEAFVGGQEAGRSRWSTAFLMVGSALLGATALALWNRRTISNMRAQMEAAPGSAGLGASAGEEIL